MDIFGNFEAMTDEQLYAYLDKITARMAIAGRAGSVGSIEQLRRLGESARMVLIDRQRAATFKQEMARTKSEIVTDPSLQPEEVDPKDARQPAPAFNRIRVQRSDRPASSVDLTPSPPAPKDT